VKESGYGTAPYRFFWNRAWDFFHKLSIRGLSRCWLLGQVRLAAHFDCCAPLKKEKKKKKKKKT
jgi:hypothetical protein